MLLLANGQLHATWSGDKCRIADISAFAFFCFASLHCTDPYVYPTPSLAAGSFARSRVSRMGGATERACSSTPADCNARGRRDPWSRPRPRRHPCERPAGAYEHLRAPLHSGACMGRCVRVSRSTPTCALSADRSCSKGLLNITTITPGWRGRSKLGRIQKFRNLYIDLGFLSKGPLPIDFANPCTIF